MIIFYSPPEKIRFLLITFYSNSNQTSKIQGLDKAFLVLAQVIQPQIKNDRINFPSTSLSHSRSFSVALQIFLLNICLVPILPSVNDYAELHRQCFSNYYIVDVSKVLLFQIISHSTLSLMTAGAKLSPSLAIIGNVSGTQTFMAELFLSTS